MAKLAVATNKEYAEKIGINPAARVTCTKPAGSTSVVLGTGSGIHPHHARHYFRRIRANKQEKPGQFFALHNPAMVEDSVSNPNDNVITFCVQVPDTAILKKDIGAIEFLEKVKSTYENWVLPGTANPKSSPGLYHNVSNTVSIKEDEWDDVAHFIYDNRECFSGISLLSDYGDKTYKQAPMEKVVSEEDAEKWNKMVSGYSPVDWSMLQETEDYTERRLTAACAGGKCEI
jgi:ribonucleoside-diphosphate reductase alpha chain